MVERVKYCPQCGVSFGNDHRFCGSCGTERTINATDSNTLLAARSTGSRIHQFRQTLASIPGLTVTSDVLEAFSGVNVAAERLKADPLNPYGHYLMSLQLARMSRQRNAYRVMRGIIQPVTVIAFTALNAALVQLDDEHIDPYESALLSTVAATIVRLRQCRDARMLLLAGVASLRLSEKLNGSVVWRCRAERSFLSVAAETDNSLVAADAAMGLMLLYGPTTTDGLQLADIARKLGSRSRLLGYPPNSGPSIWDLNGDLRSADQKLKDVVTHVANRQARRVRVMAPRIRDFISPLLKGS